MKAVLLLLLMLAGSSVCATTQSDADLLFEWAEGKYPQYFAPSKQISKTTDIWYYRYYPATGNYMGVNTTTLDAYVSGPVWGGQLRVGTLQALLSSAGLGSASCPTTSGTPMSPGPYDHQLLVATSTDGLTFTTDGVSLLEHASAPDAVVGPDGAIWVYYVNGVPGQHAIYVAKKDGNLLKPYDCVRIDGVVDSKAVDADVLRLSDGSYRMFYNPLVSPTSTAEEGIYMADSTDGIQFKNKTRLLQKAGALNPSGVQLANGSWLLTFTDEIRTYIAQSADGKNFTITLDFTPGVPELIYLAERNEVRLYNAEKSGLSVRSSTDGGATWTQLNASGSSFQDPSVLRTSPTAWSIYYRKDTKAIK